MQITCRRVEPMTLHDRSACRPGVTVFMREHGVLVKFYCALFIVLFRRKQFSEIYLILLDPGRSVEEGKRASFLVPCF